MLVSKYIPVYPQTSGPQGGGWDCDGSVLWQCTLPVLPLQPVLGGWQERAARELWVDVLHDKPPRHLWAAA